jgi:predicted acyltransferase
MTTDNPTSPEPSFPSAKTTQPGSDRLVSLDALRGFDMFWIVGGREVFLAVLALMVSKEWLVTPAQLDWCTNELKHPEWNGFAFYDLIFPLFIFMSGVSMPFSLAKRVARGESTMQLYWKVTRRAMLLVLMGLVCQGLLRFDFANLRCASVLGRIGLAYFFAALISFHTSTRGRIAWIVAILLGYWAAMMWIPVPEYGAGNLEPGKTLADYIDRQFLPGKLYKIVRDPEGILSTIPAIATALFGVLAGQWLRRSGPSGFLKAAGLLVAGGVSLLLGGLWGEWFPINKNLWTSSFVLWAGGWSLLLLGLFYLVIDVWGWKKWAFFFVVIGVNAITIYVGHQFIDFRAVGQLIFSRAPIYKALLIPSAIVATEWLFLYVLYRGRVFLRL